VSIEEKIMANKGVALLVVMCLVLVAAVKASEVYNPCYSFCSPGCITAKKSNSLCEKYCDDECAAVENLCKFHFNFHGFTFFSFSFSSFLIYKVYFLN
jgi:hypothetical protein